MFSTLICLAPKQETVMPRNDQPQDRPRIGYSGLLRLAFAASIVCGSMGIGAARANNMVTDWNNEFLLITQQTSGNLVAGPPEVAREIAQIGAAMSDAVNAATGSTISSFAYTGGSMANADANVAAATAAPAPAPPLPRAATGTATTPPSEPPTARTGEDAAGAVAADADDRGGAKSSAAATGLPARANSAERSTESVVGESASGGGAAAAPVVPCCSGSLSPPAPAPAVTVTRWSLPSEVAAKTCAEKEEGEAVAAALAAGPTATAAALSGAPRCTGVVTFEATFEAPRELERSNAERRRVQGSCW